MFKTPDPFRVSSTSTAAILFRVPHMQNDFLMTIKRLPGKLNTEGKQDKSELIKHIFAKASSIQDRISALESSGPSALASPIERPEWGDPQFLAATLREYVRLGHVLCSPEAAFEVRGVCVLDIEKLMASLSQGPHISKFHILPDIAIQPHAPRVFREGVQIAPLVEMLFQVLIAYRKCRRSELSISIGGIEHEPECKLILHCKGVRTAPGLTVNQFEHIHEELLGGVWNNWHLLGTRMVACIISCKQLDGSLRAQKIEEESLDFEVVLPMTRLAEKCDETANVRDTLLLIPRRT